MARRSAVTAAAPPPDAVVTKAVLRAANRLALPNRVLADVIGVSEATVSRMGAGTTCSRPTQPFELAVLFVRLFRGVDAIVGGDAEVARAWLNNDNTALGGTPIALISSITGLVTSLPTWTPAALTPETRRLSGSCWRVVEAQHVVSTMALVDTLEEQALLEEWIEESKPAVPVECRRIITCCRRHSVMARPIRQAPVFAARA